MKLEKSILINVLDNLKGNLVSKTQIKNAFQNVLHSKFDLNSLIRSLRRKNLIKFVFQGYYYILNGEERESSFMKYSTNESVFSILNKLKINWYLGLDTALIENKLSWSLLSRVIIINSKISGKKKILGVNYEFHKLKKNFLKFGTVNRETRNRINYYYSDIEKTIIDYVYFRKKPPIELIEKKNFNKIKKYLEKDYSKNFKKKVMNL